ncbi:hypothetical protein HDU76_001672 [Blyttiomyces sp. JEL0837]|nr:hypothetical protein HDU76_001672 [Blyttiomyces sp. JEL0837]
MQLSSALLFSSAVLRAVQAATVTFDWTVTNTTQRLDGVLRYSLGINGQPGHLTPIVVNTGDTVVVKVTNGLKVPTALHWHGLLQNGTNAMDGPVGATQCPIAPNETFTYTFHTANQEGTYWWHGHHRAQYMDGLCGPFIINNPETAKFYNYQHDETIQLADWYHDQSDNLLNWYLNGTLNPDGNEPVFNSGLINGRGQFNCNFTDLDCENVPPSLIQIPSGNVTTRLRIINTAGFAGFHFSIDGHSLTVIEVDGINVEPYVVDVLPINIAQRYSVLIHGGDKPIDNYWIRAMILHHSPWTSADDPTGFNETVVGVLSYSGANATLLPTTTSTITDSSVTLVDTNLVPIPVISPPEFNPSKDLRFNFRFKFDKIGNDTHQKAYPSLELVSQNITYGTSYSQPKIPTLISMGANKISNITNLPSTSNIVSLQKNQIVDIVIINQDPGEHPFHLHGHVFWILETGVATKIDDIPKEFNVTGRNPVRRDVVTVQACPNDENGCLAATDGSDDVQFGYSVIRFVADNPGIWLFHWHIAAGLVMQFAESPSDIVTRGVPASSLQTCTNFEIWGKNHAEAPLE